MTDPPAPGTVRPGSDGANPPTFTPTRRGRGRVTILDEALLARIVETVSVGNYLKTAAAFCGVGYSTLLLWQQKGREQQERVAAGLDVQDGHGIYLDLVEQVTQAESRAQVAAVTAWRKAFSDDWRAAKEYLARKAPDQWASSSTVHVADADSDSRVEAAVESALSSFLHQGDGEGYDPDLLAGVPPDPSS